MIHRSESAHLATGAAAGAHLTVVTRVTSIGLCVLAAVGIALLPGSAVRADALMAQAIMPILLVGALAALAYGAGLTPRNWLLARLISPIVSWPLLLSALALLMLQSTMTSAPD